MGPWDEQSDVQKFLKPGNFSFWALSRHPPPAHFRLPAIGLVASWQGVAETFECLVYIAALCGALICRRGQAVGQKNPPCGNGRGWVEQKQSKYPLKQVLCEKAFVFNMPFQTLSMKTRSLSHVCQPPCISQGLLKLACTISDSWRILEDAQSTIDRRLKAHRNLVWKSTFMFVHCSFPLHLVSNVCSFCLEDPSARNNLF